LLSPPPHRSPNRSLTMSGLYVLMTFLSVQVWMISSNEVIDHNSSPATVTAVGSYQNSCNGCDDSDGYLRFCRCYDRTNQLITMPDFYYLACPCHAVKNSNAQLTCDETYDCLPHTHIAEDCCVSVASIIGFVFGGTCICASLVLALVMIVRRRRQLQRTGVYQHVELQQPQYKHPIVDASSEAVTEAEVLSVPVVG